MIPVMVICLSLGPDWTASTVSYAWPLPAMSAFAGVVETSEIARVAARIARPGNTGRFMASPRVVRRARWGRARDIGVLVSEGSVVAFIGRRSGVIRPAAEDPARRRSTR